MTQKISPALIKQFKDQQIDKQTQKALSYELLPTAKGFLIRISFAMQAAFYHSVTRKPLDCKNNGTCMAVIKLLSKDFCKRRKPALLLGFQTFSIYSHSVLIL